MPLICKGFLVNMWRKKSELESADPGDHGKGQYSEGGGDNGLLLLLLYCMSLGIVFFDIVLTADMIISR